MARPSQLKITEEQLKRYLQKHYIDSNGNKKSVRDVWSDTEFMSYSGLYDNRSVSYDYKMVSLGTISHWNKKLGLREKELYEFYVKKGLIDESIPLSSWSRKCNRKGKPNYAGLQRDYKTYFINHFNLDYVKCRNMTLDELKSEAINIYEALGYSISNFSEDYDVFRNSFDIQDRVLSENKHINKGVADG